MKMHILMQDWQLKARVGIYPHEKESPQFLRFKLQLTLIKSPDMGEINSSVDYDWLHKTISEVCLAEHYLLLEDLSQTILNILQQKQHVVAIKMTMLKMHAFSDAKPGVLIEWTR